MIRFFAGLDFIRFVLCRQCLWKLKSPEIVVWLFKRIRLAKLSKRIWRMLVIELLYKHLKELSYSHTQTKLKNFENVSNSATCKHLKELRGLNLESKTKQKNSVIELLTSTYISLASTFIINQHHTKELENAKVMLHSYQSETKSFRRQVKCNEQLHHQTNSILHLKTQTAPIMFFTPFSCSLSLFSFISIKNDTNFQIT